MAASAPVLDRRQMLRALPRHLAWAAVCGGIAGVLLWLLNLVQLPSPWNLLWYALMGSVWSSLSMAPVALPGRHWSFAYIGSMMLALALVAGYIVASKFTFPHSAGLQWQDLVGKRWLDIVLSKVNYATFGGIICGGCLGLFYGLLAGGSAAMVTGLALGSSAGYLLGIASLRIVSVPSDLWVYDGVFNFAWQGALAMAWLHLGGCAGATFGAAPSKDK